MLTMKHKYLVPYRDVVMVASAVPTYAVYRANGMFDPDYTLTGHQPLYFDQLKQIYNHFTVLRSSIRITATVSTAQNTGSGISNQAVACLYIDDDTNPDPAQMIGVAEQPSATSVQVLQHTTSSVFYKSWDARQAFGGNTLDNSSLKGSGAADPTEQQCFVFAMVPPPSVGCTVGYTAEITYTAVWSELLPITTS